MSVDVLAELAKLATEPGTNDRWREVLAHVTRRFADLDANGYLGVLYRTDYEVQGAGEFPHDMLRYTCSWPADEQASRDMGADREDDCRVVRLTRYHRDPKPNLAEARWLSKFRWRVVRVIATTED